MKKSLLLSLILVTIIVAQLGANTRAQGDPVISTDPRPCTANVGADFELNITIADVLNLYVWEFNMTFNATVLNVVNVAEGPFLQSAGSTWWLGGVFDNVNGWVGAGCTLWQPYPEHGADGDGVLATITFNVMMKGKSNLQFVGTKLRYWDFGSGLLVEIPHSTLDSYFRCPLADTNVDGVVNVIDSSAVSAHWYPGPPIGPLGYDVNSDMDLDGAIGILDAATVSAYWTGPPKGPLDP